jgi:hypothetical protein
MDTTSLAQSRTTKAPKTTREQRGLQLFRERGDEINHLRGSVWVVPSCSGERRYVVDLERDTCSCEDSIRREDRCKHVHAAVIARAKSGWCVGCGGWFPHRQLIEVLEGHESLTFFEADILCVGCAEGSGII